MKMADYLPNLRYLGLTTKNNWTITIKGLRYVAQHCPNLTGIAFKFGDLLNRLTTEDLSTLLGDLNCKNWRVLSLRGSTFNASDEKEVESFKEKCRIFARHCPNIRVRGTSELAELVVPDLILENSRFLILVGSRHCRQRSFTTSYKGALI